MLVALDFKSRNVALTIYGEALTLDGSAGPDLALKIKDG